jgi:CheY-like chemotaxis protein
MNDKRFNVLLIEDNDADIYLLKKALDMTGLAIQLTVIGDGAKALVFARNEGEYHDAAVPDLTLLDLNLPKNDGVEVLRALKRSDRLAAMPVVIMTSSSSPVDRAKLAQLDVAQYLTKPADFDAFLRIGELIGEMLVKEDERNRNR